MTSDIEMFDILICNLMFRIKPLLSFVQIGSCDGITDDPINKYINSYSWNGILIEPIPYLFAR